MKFQIHLVASVPVCFCRFDAHAQNTDETVTPQIREAEQLSGSDGIISRAEIVDSPVVIQSHMNAGSKPTTDILSTYFLRDYIQGDQARENTLQNYSVIGLENGFHFPTVFLVPKPCPTYFN